MTPALVLSQRTRAAFLLSDAEAAGFWMRMIVGNATQDDFALENLPRLAFGESKSILHWQSQAEFRGGQEILETFIRENRLLETLLGRGRMLVGNLQTSLERLPEKMQEDAPELIQTADELSALVDQANILLPHYSELRRRYKLLPSLRPQD